ncbi:MAG: SpoIIE family protein phosphatase [Thermoanaerobaculales bacterium]|jgi:serine phosphatase RsbU (regulator of sigma subunit)|nr:SpoIIE family protein phosphatase [Thermoanaerobaculales bacterium]
MSRARRQLAVLLAPGVAAFLLAALSMADMFLPRPYDGVILEADVPGSTVVREVVPGSGADRAGIRQGDVIVGIDRSILASASHAQVLLNRHTIGESVPYMFRSGGGTKERQVELGRRRIGDTSYLYAAILGFLFFGVGAFVVVRQPRLPAARVFYLMSILFMLFLVCRLRPASYSWVDSFVLTTGTLALLILPAAFLHFFLIFPRPVWEWRHDPIADVIGWIAGLSPRLIPIYLLPPLVYLATLARSWWTDSQIALISGAPMANWWVMVGYMVLGLGALGLSARYLPEVQQRRGAGLVFVGTLFGVVPFILLAVAFPSFLNTERFIFYGVVPLILVPITFAYAIIRFQLLDIRVILRKSLLYTVTTALVTAVYALGIASFNRIFQGSALADSPYFPVVFALAIVLLFEPLRHRLQGPVDRFFFAERHRLQRAMVEMGEALTNQVEIGPVVTQLVERLPNLLGLRFAALYLPDRGGLRRVAGPDDLPVELPVIGILHDFLKSKGPLVRMDALAPIRLLSGEVDRLGDELDAKGVEVVGLMATTRRSVGVILLSGKRGQTALEREEIELLRGLLNQASIALETNLLLDERARQAELERELKIAASIQASLLPRRLAAAVGWEVAAMCRPAREVGGDFYTELPGSLPGEHALAYGDVSGKSISGALMMMAAHEVLNTLAVAHPDPEELFRLANERLYGLRGDRNDGFRSGSFVALGYLAFRPSVGTLRYSLAGQPPPLLRRRTSMVETLCMPNHRLPLGALRLGGHCVLEVELEPGDVVLAYSDGVVEAQSPEGELYGEERLARALATAPAGSPQQTVNHIVEEIEAFTRGHTPYDDLTLLAARRATDRTA